LRIDGTEVVRLIDKAKRRFKEAADLLESIEDPDEDDLHALKRLRGLQKLATSHRLIDLIATGLETRASRAADPERRLEVPLKGRATGSPREAGWMPFTCCAPTCRKSPRILAVHFGLSRVSPFWG
jgi:hypothetical protein